MQRDQAVWDTAAITADLCIIAVSKIATHYNSLQLIATQWGYTSTGLESLGMNTSLQGNSGVISDSVVAGSSTAALYNRYFDDFRSA